MSVLFVTGVVEVATGLINRLVVRYSLGSNCYANICNVNTILVVGCSVHCVYGQIGTKAFGHFISQGDAVLYLRNMLLYYGLQYA